MGKLLLISCHLAGGCFHYSNEIISRIKQPADVYVPRKVAEKTCLTGTKTFCLWGYPRIIRYLSLLWLLVKIFLLGITGYYKSMVLFGYAGWDYYIMKVWNLTRRPSYFVVHDGKMHEGDANDEQQAKLLFLMKSATCLIFLSEYVRDSVRSNFGIDKPSHIAPHGLIDYGSIQNKKQNIVPTLLFLGRVSKYKGVDVLLSAIKDVPSACYEKLIVAGKWESNMLTPNSCAKVEIIDKYLSENEMLSLLENADIIIFPYLEATQSGVASLAINYLKPSIVTNVGAFKEQFSDKTALFIEPNDSSSLAHAIEMLCGDLELRKSMVTELRKEKNKFNWSQITNDLEKYIIKNESTNS